MRKNKQRSNGISYENQIHNNEDENWVDIQISEEDKIEIRNRTFELESNEESYQYYILITSTWTMCNWEFHGDILKSYINERIKGKDLILYYLILDSTMSQSKEEESDRIDPMPFETIDERIQRRSTNLKSMGNSKNIKYSGEILNAKWRRKEKGA